VTHVAAYTCVAQCRSLRWYVLFDMQIWYWATYTVHNTITLHIYTLLRDLRCHSSIENYRMTISKWSKTHHKDRGIRGSNMEKFSMASKCLPTRPLPLVMGWWCFLLYYLHQYLYEYIIWIKIIPYMHM
jgi:hypothetical protein